MIIEELYTRSKSKFRFLLKWFKSLIFGQIFKHKFRRVTSICLFIGYPRSGHSLIASLLDAHPNMVMAMEWDLLSHFRMGFSKNQIYYSLLRNANLYAKRKKNIWTGYSYRVDGLWQGRHETIKMIGDKLGGRNSMLLQDNFSIMERLHSTLNVPIKLIHVIRNPFDTITTMTLRSIEKKDHPDRMDPILMLPFIKLYFDRVDVVKSLKESNRHEIFDLYHEQFLENPKNGLEELLNFLELEVTENYLDRCVKIVFREPRRSRQKIEWPQELKDFVQNKMNTYDFLKIYSFET